MKNEIERRLMILHKVCNVCKRIQAFVICLVGMLIVLELLDVRIDFGKNSIKLAIFILITGFFFVSDTVMVYLQTWNDDLSKKRLVWNLFVIWTSNVFVLCCTHNYIFGSSYLHILPTAVAVGFIIGGVQFTYFSSCILTGRFYRERNELLVLNEMLRQQQEHHAMQDDDTSKDEDEQCILHSDYSGHDKPYFQIALGNRKFSTDY